MSNQVQSHTPIRLHSGAYPDAPHGLVFIEPAMSEFVDEAHPLVQANVEGMKRLSDSLASRDVQRVFRELAVYDADERTYDRLATAALSDYRRWQHELTDVEERLRQLQQNAIAAMEAMKAARAAREMEEASAAVAAADRTAMTDADTTNTTTNASALSAKSMTVVKKKAAKPKLTAKKKKKRSVCPFPRMPALNQVLNGQRGV
ncbi:hypothetical protein HGRIS_011831 [Hohenbuehelia grisea]|uniref:Uncharacterized protein n=1 Tax=Hohenbuehelia grisea TaxID=104357 RepID=A0ABR3JYI0_9AGAR